MPQYRTKEVCAIFQVTKGANCPTRTFLPVAWLLSVWRACSRFLQVRVREFSVAERSPPDLI